MSRVAVILMLAGCPSAEAPSWTLVEANSPASPTGATTLAEPVGIETLGGVFTPLMTEGCPLPCIATEVFSTAADNQDSISLSLFRGRNVRLASDAVSLGQYQITGIAPAPRGVPQVLVRFEARDGLIRVSAKDDAADSGFIIKRVERLNKQERRMGEAERERI